jgi:sulfite reductase alpha subunit
MSEEPKEVTEGRKILSKLEDGPWPSYVKEANKTKYHMKLYGASLYLKRDLWTTGGYVSVPGVPTGILMRVTSRPDIGESANVVRIYMPAANFVTSKMLRVMADFADKYGVGMVHAITTGDDFEIPGIPKERIRDFADEFRQSSGTDVGSTGDAFRSTTCCVGPTLCEYANFDSLKMRDDFYEKFGDYGKYPTFPHKLKLKISGCPLDCARATQKGDIAVVGSWVGGPHIDQGEMRALDETARKAIVDCCPTGALYMRNHRLEVDEKDCTQCMECIRLSKGAIMPGEKKRLLVYVGGKLRGKKGPFSSKLLAVLDSEEQVFNLLEKIVNVYADNAARKERLGDLIIRIGMRRYTQLMDLEVKPSQVSELRTNIFYGVDEKFRTKVVHELAKSVEGDAP